MVFCPLLKKTLDNPYMKPFYFSQLLVADAPIKFFPPQIQFKLSHSIFGTSGTRISTLKI